MRGILWTIRINLWHDFYDMGARTKIAFRILAMPGAAGFALAIVGMAAWGMLVYGLESGLRWGSYRRFPKPSESASVEAMEWWLKSLFPGVGRR